jgi:hypothetical protein
MSVITQCGSLNSLEDKLTSLLFDIHDLQMGEIPRSMDLSAAPVIDQWSYGLVPARCIVGSRCGHSIVSNRTRVHTSQLVLVDPENSWARTWSRCYRLGTPETPATSSGGS